MEAMYASDTAFSPQGAAQRLASPILNTLPNYHKTESNAELKVRRVPQEPWIAWCSIFDTNFTCRLTNGAHIRNEKNELSLSAPYHRLWRLQPVHDATKPSVGMRTKSKLKRKRKPGMPVE